MRLQLSSLFAIILVLQRAVVVAAKKDRPGNAKGAKPKSDGGLCEFESKIKKTDLGRQEILITCGSDDDCGAPGAICEPYPVCRCTCPDGDCLTKEPKTGFCSFNCACEDSCDGDGKCDDSQCPQCVETYQCAADEECIGGYCVSSGLCTTAKDEICDAAYTSMTGSSKKRVKCCPSSSDCVKSIFGVEETSTCGASCGASCLGAASYPGGGGTARVPATFCAFGNSVDSLEDCAALAEADRNGAENCSGGGDFCCIGTGDTASFDCNPASYSYLGGDVCLFANAIEPRPAKARIMDKCDRFEKMKGRWKKDKKFKRGKQS